MDMKDTTAELLDIADHIKELILRKHQIEKSRVPLINAYQNIRYTVYNQVCEAVDEKGKLKYSNEDRRRQEVEHRLRNDDATVKLVSEMQKNRSEIGEIIAEINRLQDRKLILLVAMGAPLPQNIVDKEGEGKYSI